MGKNDIKIKEILEVFFPVKREKTKLNLQFIKKKKVDKKRYNSEERLLRVYAESIESKKESLLKLNKEDLTVLYNIAKEPKLTLKEKRSAIYFFIKKVYGSHETILGSDIELGRKEEKIKKESSSHSGDKRLDDNDEIVKKKENIHQGLYSNSVDFHSDEEDVSVLSYPSDEKDSVPLIANNASGAKDDKQYEANVDIVKERPLDDALEHKLGSTPRDEEQCPESLARIAIGLETDSSQGEETSDNGFDSTQEDINSINFNSQESVDSFKLVNKIGYYSESIHQSGDDEFIEGLKDKFTTDFKNAEDELYEMKSGNSDGTNDNASHVDSVSSSIDLPWNDDKSINANFPSDEEPDMSKGPPIESITTASIGKEPKKNTKESSISSHSPKENNPSIGSNNQDYSVTSVPNTNDSEDHFEGEMNQENSKKSTDGKSKKNKRTLYDKIKQIFKKGKRKLPQQEKNRETCEEGKRKRLVEDLQGLDVSDRNNKLKEEPSKDVKQPRRFKRFRGF